MEHVHKCFEGRANKAARDSNKREYNVSNAASLFINPRRACAARVTVVVLAGACLSVCLSVCYHVFFLCTHLSGQVATRTASE